MSDTKKPTLLIIDGHSLAFRAFYALPLDSFQNRDGQHTNAIHGFIAMLINLLKAEKPSHIAVAFDISRYSFRTRINPDYKGTRGETPAQFIGQIPLLEEALKAMNIVTITKEDFEADDILATLATRGREDGFRVFVVSGDRDTFQLINDDVTVLYPSVRGVSELKRYDRDAVFERYGIEPAQYPDIAALVGETSDNLIGIDKVGEKTAIKWVLKYGDLAGILEHADEITGVVGDKLREQGDRAIANRKLNRLVTDVDLPVAPADLVRRPINEGVLREVFAKLQFKTLLERVLTLEQDHGFANSSGALDASGGADSDPARDNGSVTRSPGSENSAPVVRTMIDEELARWLETNSQAGTQPLALRVHTVEGTVSGFGISSLTESVYVPWAPQRPDYVAFEAWLASPAPKYVEDAKRQLSAIFVAGLDCDGLKFDTSLAAWLIKPSGKATNLSEQVYDFLGETLAQPDPNQLMPLEDEVSPATHAWYIMRISLYLAERLEPSSRSVLETIELPLVPVLASMELDGITVNCSILANLSAQLGATASELATQAYAEIGHEVNLASPKQLQQVLFEELAMPKTRANKTGFSTDAASLTDLQEQAPHPFLDLLLKHRDATKLRQIVETIDKAVGVDGRVHTTYDQTGSSTGRISSNDPNLQNIPIRSEEGRQIRAAFEHGAGFTTVLTADYSQIEMRIMAHLSGDEGLIEAFNSGEDLHRFVGARIFGVETTDVTPLMRTKVKAMSYGLAYGLSAYGLSKQLRIDTGEAKKLMADYFERFGAVREYLRLVVAQAKVDGYTETMFGRRRPFTDLSSNNRVLRENAERQALNAPIQGTAADIIKIAMLGVAKDLTTQKLASRLLLQVHDELVLEVADGELDAVTHLVRERMGSAAVLRVPLDVHVGTGANWNEAAH